jgi:hypothetical protein
MSAAECRTNRGNLMQHWTLCESLKALRDVTQATNPLLLYIDAHAMKPLSRFTVECEDERFGRVRKGLPGQNSLYEESWQALVPGDEMRYPSSAAFVDRIWDSKRAYLLCEKDSERAEACTEWMRDLDDKGRVFFYEVFNGDWIDRFKRDERFPFPRLKQDKDTVKVVEPNAVFASFDPNMVSRKKGVGKRDPFNLYANEFPAIWNALSSFASLPVVIQISTYSTQDGNKQSIVEKAVKESRPPDWCGPVKVQVDGSMMSLLFWSSAADKIVLDDLPGRFDAWVAAIDRQQ